MERRYDEGEVAAIFRAAAEGTGSTAPRGTGDEGLTLAEIQEIGREVGIAPEAVSNAALALATRPQAAARSFLGLPVGVERSVALSRNLTDKEWELLVVRLREVFDARGVLSTHGTLREWRNGNLQALIEPTPEGHRLRLRTVKGDLREYLAIGGVLLFMGILMSVFGVINERGFPVLGAALAAVGATFGLFSVLRLPAWARLRSRQMEEIAAEVAQKQLP